MEDLAVPDRAPLSPHKTPIVAPQPTLASPQMLRVADVARMLSTTSRSVYAWIAAGRLKTVRISRRCVRVERAELERFIASARTS